MSKRHRKDVAGEHPFGDTGQILLLFIFLAVWILDSFILRYSIFVAQHISLFIRLPLAIIILFFAGYLAKAGMAVVHDDTAGGSGVIREGAFSLVRHPVYLGSILFYLGLLALTLSLFTAVVFIAIVVFYHYIALYEEKLLLEKYGSEYEEYMKRVSMWIPWTK
jgi:protein-S-isoprenylcysteine O-methyltransferase Ste14